MAWRLNKRAQPARVNWRLNKKSKDAGAEKLQNMEVILSALIQTQKKMQVMDGIDETSFWMDKEHLPILFQQLFRIGHMHSLIMKELVSKTLNVLFFKIE